MQRFFIFMSFDGTCYHGWQRQPNGVSVQQRTEEALATLLQQPTAVTGAGRTDAGVHAHCMVAHFDSDNTALTADLPLLAKKLNGLLPHDIAINRIVRVRPDAHARFSARARTYIYSISLTKQPIGRHYCLQLHHTPDFDRMNRAAAMLMQYTDFTSFSRLHTDVKTNICHLTHAEWTPTGPDTWVFTITADRFLRNMVRAIVGTLFEVGRGRLSLDEFRQIVESRDRCRAGSSAPAHGLSLARIDYDLAALSCD
jgi:tRNA pseudouridine38-40 synthase